MKCIRNEKEVESLKERKVKKKKRKNELAEGKGVEWEEDNNVKHMWEQVKRAMVESAREVCSSVRVWERTQRVCRGTMR